MASTRSIQQGERKFVRHMMDKYKTNKEYYENVGAPRPKKMPRLLKNPTRGR